jgi:hypothetical protein
MNAHLIKKIVFFFTTWCFVLAVSPLSVQAATKEEKIASIKGAIQAAKQDAKENQRLYEYYRYRNIMAGKVMCGMSAGPGTHLGPNGETLEPLQPSNAEEEFASSQDLMNYHEQMVKDSEALAAQLEKDLVVVETAPAVKAEAEPGDDGGSEGGGY